MTELAARPHALLADHASVRGVLATYGPPQLEALRERALRRFSEFGVPTTKDEEFKYLSLRALDDGGFRPAYGATVDRAAVAGTPLGDLDATTVTFVNGQHAPELSSMERLPDGVFVGTLQDGFEAMEATVLAHLGQVATLEGKLGSTNDERFVDLNTAYLGEGAYVFVPRGVALERPIHLQFLTLANHGPLAAHPRVLVVLEDQAEAKIVESHVGLGGVAFNNAVAEIWLGRAARLEHTRLQAEGADGVHIGNLSVHQETESYYTSNAVNFGAKVARLDLNVWSGGEHTETWLNAASVGTGRQVIDNHTRIDHAKPNCHSFEVYKSILDDHASGVFNGKIFVYEDAQKTDAKQTNAAILLSKDAGINTKPQLEIFADDVKCTHGATVGQLREDALFYLRARGVPKREAEALLVYAFAAEVLEKVTIPAVREALEAALFRKLGRHG